MKQRAPFLAILAALVFSPSLLAKAPDDQYEEFGDGETTIRDLQTRLEWDRGVSSEGFTYATALAGCPSPDAGVGIGWRLPTVKELQTLIDEEPTKLGGTPRYLDPNAFPVGSSPIMLPYWTDTKSGNGSERFAVSFTTGATSSVDPNTQLFVRCVRSIP